MSSLFFSGCSKDFGKETGETEAETETTEVLSDTSVVGTWSEDIFDSGYIFESDGTGEDTFWELTFTYTAVDGILTITYDSDTYGSASYTYSVEGDVLTMTRISEDEETSAFEYTKAD